VDRAYQSDQAFDALVSAEVMYRYRDSIGSLKRPRIREWLMEGAIWAPDACIKAAREADTQPPPMVPARSQSTPAVPAPPPRPPTRRQIAIRTFNLDIVHSFYVDALGLAAVDRTAKRATIDAGAKVLLLEDRTGGGAASEAPDAATLVFTIDPSALQR